MIITAINPYEKGKNRVAVYLNDEFAFVLYKGELSKYKLAVGIEIDDDLYARILNETLFKRARLRGMNLLQKTDRTESDLRTKLRDGGYPDIVIDDAIEYLKSFKYIDDERYAANFVNYKRNSLSKREIARKLKEKGIADSIIENVLMEFSADDELELIKKLMIKKCPDLINIEYNEKIKLFSYLYRKGYTMDNIERAFRDLT